MASSASKTRRPLHHAVWQSLCFTSIHAPKMALKANVIPYFALLSIIISIVPGLFWLYQRKIRPRKSGQNSRQEARHSHPNTYLDERQLPPTYLYLEESRCRKTWILQRDVPTNTSSPLSPVSHRMPVYPIASLDPGSQVVRLPFNFQNTYIMSFGSLPTAL